MRRLGIKRLKGLQTYTTLIEAVILLVTGASRILIASLMRAL